MDNMEEGKFFCNGDNNSCREKLGKSTEKWVTLQENRTFRRCKKCFYSVCKKCTNTYLNSLEYICPNGHMMEMKLDGRHYCNGNSNNCRA